jgi:hypothetical protein
MKWKNTPEDDDYHHDDHNDDDGGDDDDDGDDINMETSGFVLSSHLHVVLSNGPLSRGFLTEINFIIESLISLLYIIIIIIIIIITVSCHRLSSWYFSCTSSDPHRSGFKFHTAVLSVLCVMFQL